MNRYEVRPFSATMIGVWDCHRSQFIKNPNGRKKLFYLNDSAEACANMMNMVERERLDTLVSDRENEIKALNGKIASLEVAHRLATPSSK